MKRGYLPLYRKIQDHQFYKEKRVFSKYEAWLDILMEAQHSEEPKDVILGMTVLVCNYGESLKSIKTWSKRWKWTESKVRRYFILLGKLKQIRTKSEVVTTRLSVINYNAYDPRRRVSEAQATRKRRGADEQATTDNNDKKVKNENNEKNIDNTLSEFQYFWDLYQKKKDHKKCLAKWKLLTKKEKDSIFQCVFSYVQSTKDKQYRKNPLTWLNGKCWNDEIVANLNPAEQRLKQNIEVSKEWLNE